MKLHKISVRNLGQIKEADITFGDLTVFVGPQATGKSIFMQLLKLLLDSGSIRDEFDRFNMDWGKDLRHFMELYFGGGMEGIYDPSNTLITQDHRKIEIEKLLRKSKRDPESAFLIPAQRVLSLKDGLTRPFQEYRLGDPYSLREFSERMHNLVQTEFGKKNELFPVPNRLREEYRTLLNKHIFRNFELKTDQQQLQRRLVMSLPDSPSSLPYLVWSAGQREFVPLLLGLYWLMPPGAIAMREGIKWVLIEEPEMGLHPNAISVVLLLVFDLLKRGYRVCLSTHSPHILDVVWALRVFRDNNGTEKDVRDIFTLKASDYAKELGASVMKKHTKVHYFQANGIVKDISELDPGSEENEESGWGGLTEFSCNIGNIVARVVNRSELNDLQSNARVER